MRNERSSMRRLGVHLYGRIIMLYDNVREDLIKISNNFGRSCFSDPFFGYLNFIVGNSQSEINSESKAEPFQSPH